MNNKISALMLVKNEEQWIWYSIMSVLPFVQEMIVFDTGSTDRTLNIIKSIKTKKISFKEKGEQNRANLVRLRNEMIKKCQGQWFLLVDGDEVWSGESLTKLTESINQAGQDIWGVVVRTRNCVGDIFHYQEESAGRYRLLGKKGHYTIRAFRKDLNFQWMGEYPLEYYANKKGVAIQQFQKHLKFVDTAYWHLTHLFRSSKSADVIDRGKKQKRETGILAKREEIPEIFFRQHPDFVPTPFITMSTIEKFQAGLFTPLKKIKRRIIK